MQLTTTIMNLCNTAHDHRQTIPLYATCATSFPSDVSCFIPIESCLPPYHLVEPPNSPPPGSQTNVSIQFRIDVSVFVKACKEQIDILKTSITDEEANAKGWLGIRADNENADTIAHKHGVVLILSETLHSVTSQFDQLRAVRFQEAINRVMPRRKPKAKPKWAPENDVSQSESTSSETRNSGEITTEPMKVQKQQLLDDETRALQVELSSLLDAARDTETKMVEMSALNHLMSTHVLQQAQQIEYLYDQAVEATKNV